MITTTRHTPTLEQPPDAVRVTETTDGAGR